MRALLVALVVVVLLPLEGIAKPGARLRGKTVAVYDYTPADWKPVVAQTVAEFNRMLPRRGAPKLVYRAMPETPCSAMPTRKRAIGICLLDVDGDSVTIFRERKDWLSGVRIEMGHYPATWPAQIAARDGVLCHEFMHATTGAPEVGKGNDRTSCLWGVRLTAPGKQDRAFAREVYQERQRKHR